MDVIDVLRSLLGMKRQDQLNPTDSEEVTQKTGERSYELVCKGVRNYMDTCYISVAVQCILAMQATRPAFINFQNPVGSDICCVRSYRSSMTASVRFFFLQRRLPNMMTEEERKEYSRNDLYPAATIANWLHQRFPDSFNSLGWGNYAPDTFHMILRSVIDEGYINGLAENLTGKYTCKSSGASADSRDHDLIMLRFSVNEGQNFDFLKYINTESEDHNNGTGFNLRVGSLFYFAELTNVYRLDKLTQSKSAKSAGCDVRHRTTIRHLPPTLILDIERVHCSESMKLLYEEFLDLSEHMESHNTTSCNYKLVAAIKEILGGDHVIAYVRASTYLKQNVNISSAVYDKVGKMWFKLDDEYLDIVDLEEMFKVQPDERLILLIYEQLN